MGANPLRVSLFLLFLSQAMLSADLVMVEGLHGLEDMAPKDYDEEYQRLVSLYTGNKMQSFRSRMKNGGLLRLMKSLDDVPPQQENTFETGPRMSRARRGEEMSGDQPGYTGYSSRIMRSPLKAGKIMLN